MFVHDAAEVVVPEWDGKGLAMGSEQCILVGCLNPYDGETTLTLADDVVPHPAAQLAYKGPLRTPTRRIVIESSEAEELLSIDVASDRVDVRVWVNDAIEPDEVAIEVLALGV